MASKQYGRWFLRVRLREQGFSLISEFDSKTNTDKVEFICKKCGKKKKALVSSVLKGIRCGHTRKPHTKEKERLRSAGYSAWRDDVKFRYGHKSAKSGDRDFLVVHHMVSIQRYKNLILCPFVGLPLTEDEHKEFHIEYGHIDFSIEDNYRFLGYSPEEAWNKKAEVWEQIKGWLEEQEQEQEQEQRV